MTSFEAHQDYIRYIEVHPSQPYVLTTSDDMTIKLWDWDKSWSCVQTYEGHSHYVMMARINPKDTNTFATASLDRSVKVWSLGAPSHNFSLEGHERGVNCLDYYPGGDKPYIVTGADDFTLRVWDYQTRSCVSVLEGHSNNVCAVLFHARLPFILSGSEDGTLRIWHAGTYRAESTLNYGFERAWCLAGGAGHNVAAGFDDGTIVLKLGREVPVASMDKNGKIIMCVGVSPRLSPSAPHPRPPAEHGTTSFSPRQCGRRWQTIFPRRRVPLPPPLPLPWHSLTASA